MSRPSSTAPPSRRAKRFWKSSSAARTSGSAATFDAACPARAVRRSSRARSSGFSRRASSRRPVRIDHPAPVVQRLHADRPVEQPGVEMPEAEGLRHRPPDRPLARRRRPVDRHRELHRIASSTAFRSLRKLDRAASSDTTRSSAPAPARTDRRARPTRGGRRQGRPQVERRRHCWSGSRRRPVARAPGSRRCCTSSVPPTWIGTNRQRASDRHRRVGRQPATPPSPRGDQGTRQASKTRSSPIVSTGHQPIEFVEPVSRVGRLFAFLDRQPPLAHEHPRHAPEGRSAVELEPGRSRHRPASAATRRELRQAVGDRVIVALVGHEDVAFEREPGWSVERPRPDVERRPGDPVPEQVRAAGRAEAAPDRAGRRLVPGDRALDASRRRASRHPGDEMAARSPAHGCNGRPRGHRAARRRDSAPPRTGSHRCSPADLRPEPAHQRQEVGEARGDRPAVVDGDRRLRRQARGRGRPWRSGGRAGSPTVAPPGTPPGPRPCTIR